MLTAVQSLRLSAVEMASWFPERQASMTEQVDESGETAQSTKPPGFGLLRASQLFDPDGSRAIPTV
jgi:hypothetical protein